MNVPLVVVGCGLHEGDLPGTMSFVTLGESNICLAAMKKSQHGGSIILRLVEVEGRETAAKLTLAPALLLENAIAVEVDTLERPLPANGAKLEGDTLTVTLPAFGITTVAIEPAS
jgi:alpha-mannosidase